MVLTWSYRDHILEEEVFIDMKAKISQIKAELSKYIRLAIKGEKIIITDRDQPVAILTRIPDESQLKIKAPESNLKHIFSIADKRSFNQSIDILDVLLEDREDRL